MTSNFLAKLMAFGCFLLFACDKNMALVSQHCDCHIDTLRLAQPGHVTYQVFTNGDAAVSSITYKTTSGSVTVANPKLPFDISIPLHAGDTIQLQALGNPASGNIGLSYDFKENGTPENGPLLFNTARVWVLKDGNCQ